MAHTYNLQFKTIVVGNAGVGKTCLIRRLTKNDFNGLHTLTIGVELDFKTLQVDGQEIRLQLWDTAGMEKFRTITQAYYRGSILVFIVYDITDAKSFYEATTDWYQNVKKFTHNYASIVLIGNKCDQYRKRAVTKEELKHAGERLGISYAEVSCATGEGVTEVFTQGCVDVLAQKSIMPPNVDFNKYGIKLGRHEWEAHGHYMRLKGDGDDHRMKCARNGSDCCVIF